MRDKRKRKGGDIEAAARAAEVTVSRRYRMNRQGALHSKGVRCSPVATIGSIK